MNLSTQPGTFRQRVRRLFSTTGPPKRMQELVISRAVVLLAAAFIGLILGIQWFQVNPRIVKSILALAVFFIFVRFPVYIGVGAFLVLYPYPSAVAIGNTNFVFAILFTMVWIVKVGLGMEEKPQGSLVGKPVFFLLVVHILSLIMLPEWMNLKETFRFQQFLLAAVLMFAVMTSTVTSQKRLHYIFHMLTIGSIVVNLQSVLQFIAPTLRIIPVWYYSSPALGAAVEFGGRVGGVFRSHPLLADSASMTILLQLFMVSRCSGKRLQLLYHIGVIALAIITLFITVNRGGMVILVLGLGIVGWYLRSELKFSRIAIAASVLVLVFIIAETVTSGRYEQEVTMFSRLAGTRFESLMPENRAIVWTAYWAWILESPFLGHGPRIDTTVLGFWPHNAYLFYTYTTGLLGLSIFLLIILKIIIKTRPKGRVSWTRGSYVKGALLLVHVIIIQFSVGQLRTDHQRGNVFIYLTYSLLAQASIIYRLSEEEDRRRHLLTGKYKI